MQPQSSLRTWPGKQVSARACASRMYPVFVCTTQLQPEHLANLFFLSIVQLEYSKRLN